MHNRKVQNLNSKDRRTQCIQDPELVGNARNPIVLGQAKALSGIELPDEAEGDARLVALKQILTQNSAIRRSTGQANRPARL